MDSLVIQKMQAVAIYKLIFIGAAVVLSGCATNFRVNTPNQAQPAASAGPTQPSTTPGTRPRDPLAPVAYGYQPLDPAPIYIRSLPPSRTATPQEVLDSLPDETMRLAIGQFDATGNVTYGPVTVSASDTNYVVTIDYIKSTTHPLFVKKGLLALDGSFTATVVDNEHDADISVPVYIGVGLRLTAILHTSKGGINLGNIVAIGAAAQASQLTGTMVLQTLGLTGENISTALPIPSDISVASIQSAMQAIGTMKAKLYDTKNTTIVPRVVGVYNNLGAGPDTINGIISSVLARPLPLDVRLKETTAAN